MADKISFLIAYSGGLDSTVLLHRFVSLRNRYNKLVLRAIYINHGISKNSFVWEEHCKSVCENFNVEFISRSINISTKTGKSLEDIARELRYRTISNVINSNEILLTAHHANDQAETVLLNLFRGSSVFGLSGIKYKRKLFGMNVLRPLLKHTKDDLIKYAKAHSLSWIDDESNLNNDFKRNFIRNKLFDIIRYEWPGAITTLNRVSELQRESAILLSEFAIDDLKNIQTTSFGSTVLQIDKLTKHSYVRQKNIVLEWIRRLNFIIPNSRKISQVFSSVIYASEDRNPDLCWDGVIIKRYRNYLYCINSDFLEEKNRIKFLDNIKKNKKYKEFELRFRKDGDRFLYKKSLFKKRLNKLFQEIGIPPWMRDNVVLACEDGFVVLLLISFLSKEKSIEYYEYV